jgi:hypothetical protein
MDKSEMKNLNCKSTGKNDAGKAEMRWSDQF